jgi:hypothetical protein
MSFVEIKAHQRALRVEAGAAVMAMDAVRIQSIRVQLGRLEAARLELEGHAEQFARAAADMAFGIEPPSPLRRALADAAAAQSDDDANPMGRCGARGTGSAAYARLEPHSAAASPGELAPAEASPALRTGVLGKRPHSGDAEARAGAKTEEAQLEAGAEEQTPGSRRRSPRRAAGRAAGRVAAAAAPAVVPETPYSDSNTADAAAAVAEEEEGAVRAQMKSTTVAPLSSGRAGGYTSAGAGAPRRAAPRRGSHRSSRFNAPRANG